MSERQNNLGLTFIKLVMSLRVRYISVIRHLSVYISYFTFLTAALGRKMRVWERRLMRDFHVSPAMGSEDVIARGSIHEPAEETAAEKFRRVARLAMKAQAINTDNQEL